MGLISVVMMVVAACLMIGGELLRSEGGDVLAGFGALLAFPALACGPTAAGIGLFALTKPHTALTAFGRRHASIGAAAGLATLALCCVVGLVIGSSN